MLENRAGVVVAESDPHRRHHLVSLLADYYDVTPVADGNSAIAELALGGHRLLLASGSLPDLPSAALLQRLRSQPATGSLPTIFIMDGDRQTDPSAGQQILKAGNADLLRAPLVDWEVLGRVRASIDRATASCQDDEALEKERSRLRMALMAARMVTIQWDLITDTIVLSENAPEIFGHLPRSVLENSEEAFQLVHPEDLEEVRTTIERAIVERGEFQVDYRLFRPDDGKVIWLEERGYVVTDETGRAVKLIAVAVDITSRRQAEVEIQEREQYLKAIFDTTPECIKVVTADGKLKRMNAAGLAMIEASSGHEVAGQSVYKLIAPEHRDMFRDFHRRVCEGQSGVLQFAIIGLQGTRRDMETHAAPLQLANGEIAQLAVTRDISERKRAETSLRESEEQFHRMANNAPTMLWVTDPQGRCTFLSEGWYAFTGQSGDESLGHGWLKAIHPDDRANARRAITEAIERHRTFSIDYRLRRHDGKYRVTLDSGRPMFAADGSFEGFIGSVIDVHERRQAEEFRAGQTRILEMITSEQPLFDILVELVRRVERRIPDCKGSILLADDNGQRLHYGAAPQLPDAYNRAVDGVTIGPDVGSCGTAAYLRQTVVAADIQNDPKWEGFKELAATHGLRACWSEPIISADGTLLGTFAIYFSTPCSPSKEELDSLMEFARFAGIAIERPRAQAALRESEERFRMLADNMSQLAWMSDELGTATWYNQRWYEYTGSTLAEMQAEGWERVHHPDHLDRVEKSIERARASGEVWEDTFPLLGRDGEYRWFLSRAVPIRNRDGKIVRWFGTNTDVNELRETQRLLREADRRKDEFLAMLAHELRNPLAPIRSGLDILAIANDVEHQDVIRVMQEQVAHVVRLVDDLLDMSRIMRGKIELRKERILLEPTVKRVIDAVEPIIRANGHTLSVTLPSRDVWLDADPVRIVQVLENLLNNATKYMDGSGSIKLSATVVDQNLTIQVSDEGIGIASEFLPKVFELFAQSDKSLDRARGGLGIGLTLVKQLVEMHGGTVHVESEGLGHGSRFRIEMAVATPPKRTKPTQNNSFTAKRPRSILVVDDNRGAAMLLSRLLQKLGDHKIRTASDGESALEAIRSEKPEIILLDIGLPGLSGYEVAGELRSDSRFDDVLLIALTGYGQEQDRAKSKAIGFDEHLVKPPSIDQMKFVLSHSKLATESERAG